MFDFFGLLKGNNKTRILIVDDEPALIQTLQDRLEMSGYSIITACNGQDGLEKALRHKPDVIIIDVIMPVMDGLETVEAMRKHPEIKDCPVIMLTARSQAQDLARAKASGVKDYIVKPFSLAKLLEKIEAILEEQKALVN